MDADALLGGLDDQQRRAVTSEAAPLAILAGAGAGKTRVLTRRIAWRAATGSVDPRRVLAVTFTRKAAGELRARLAQLDVQPAVTAGTIHALALAQLRARYTEQRRDFPALLERKARLLVPLTGRRGADARVAASELAGEIEWAKARGIRPDGYTAAVRAAGRNPPRDDMAAVYGRYEREKQRRGLVDFDDLLWSCAEVLETDPEFAAAQRWRFRALFVDEFQDISPAQLRLVRAWLGDRTDLCVVGDADQAIYGFGGADPSFLTDFARHFPTAEVLHLGRNYRSTPQIVDTAEAVLRDAGGARPPRVGVRASGPRPTVTEYDSEEDEARRVAARLQEARTAERRWSDLAVLYRTNAQSAAFESALSAVGIPFRVRGAGSFLDRPEVRAALDRLRDAARDAPGRSFAEHLVDLDVVDAAAGGERSEHGDALVRLGREYLDAEPGSGSLDGFLAFLTAALRDDAPIDEDAVELLTFHRAKGLEFHTVFVTGLERGLVPISYADTPPERAEERRLLYVALSRAEQALHCSWARSRTFGLRTARRSPSPWLEPIGSALRGDATDVAARPAPAGVRAARARLVAAAGEPTVAGAALFAALRDWRRGLARASGVPAYVIFPDSTLRAVAESRPATAEDLLALPGVGPVKAARHGDAVLQLVRSHT
ncbi:MAG TPA: ATP-dependent DNA helicase UvrD2 [Acidimicrobiia bacterium]|nr:ATP-dependent DNA helicase UvrD2 [Acidimicrobiia bacterium]